MSDNPDDMMAIEQTAAEWVVRGQSPDVREADIVALTEWLEASDRHADAYRAALGIWSRFEPESAPETKSEPVAATVSEYVVADTELSNVVHWHTLQRKAPARRAAVNWGVGSAVAAALVAAIALPFVMDLNAPVTDYQTAKGERRTVALADGSTLTLNTDTHLTVQMRKRDRVLKLDHGEVALQVAHDAARPFTLDTADVRITDIGTEFNVLRQDNAVRVTVKEGIVSLKPRAQGEAMIVRAGEAGLHSDGATSSILSHVNAQEAFAWQSAHAIYRDQPLSAVVKDLNRYFATPIIVDNETGKLRLTAILTLDSEDSVVGRLEDFLSLDARTTDKGIVLSRTGGRGRQP